MSAPRHPRSQRAARLIERWAPVAGLTAVAVPFVVLVVRQLSNLRVEGTPCCDWAALEMGTRAFLRGEQLVGLYSREGWRHPGPAQFLWDSLFRVLPGRSFAEHQVAAAVLGGLAIATVALAALRRLGRNAMLSALAVVAVWMVRFGVEEWALPWNPVTAMSWVVITVVAAAAYTSGGSRWWLLATAAAGSMAVQTHVGTAPAVAVPAALVVVHAWRRRAEPGAGPRVYWVAVVIGLLWLLPLIDLVAVDHSLATAIDELLFSAKTDPVRRRDVAKALVHILGMSPAHQGTDFGLDSPYSSGAALTLRTVALAIAGLALGVYAVVRRKRHRLSSQLVVMAGTGLVLTGIALTRANGPFYRYLVFPAIGLGALVWVGGFIAITADLANRWPARRNLLALAQLGIVVVAAAIAIPPSRPPLATSASNATIQELSAGVRAACDELPDVAIVTSTAQWTDELPVAAAIERCTTVRVVGWSGFIAGQPYEADDDAEPNVYIGPRSEAPSSGTDIAVSGDQVVRILTGS